MKTRVAVLGWLIIGPIGITAVVVAFMCVARGEILSAIVAVGGAAFCFGILIPTVKAVPGRVAPRVENDSAGTTFRPDRSMDIPVQAALAGLVLATALITILLPIGKLTIPVPPNMRVALPFMAAAIAVTGAPMVWRNLRRGSTSYLRLTVEGFEIAQGWRHRSASWSSVKDVASEAPSQTKPTPGAIVFVMSDDAAWTLTALSFAPDGAALRDLVRFYWQHPESRDELIDGRAAERIAARL